jgi:type VI secretion system protein ImpA
LNEDLQQCIEELDQLAGVLAEKCGKDENGNSLAPPASGIQEALLECQKIVWEFAKDKLPPPPQGAGGPAKEEGGMAPEESSAGRGSTPPTDKEKLIHQVKMTRKDALRQLRDLAAFFKATEPHSPISYALERIAAWGELPLPALWSEIIAEDGARSSAFKLVGIPPAQGAQEPGK